MKKTLIILLIMISNIVIFGGIKQIDSYCGFLTLDATKNGSIEKSIREINNNEEEIETIFFYIDNKNIEVSSRLNSNKNIDYEKENILDHNVSTAWVEGKKGYGIGECIEIKLGENELPLRNIDIYNGYCKDMKTWKKNSRVKKFKLYVDNIPYAILNLADSMECQSFPVDIEDCENKILRFEIVDVYRGDKFEDTAISEILFEYHSCCFPAITKISLSDNSVKTIDKLKSGDEVLTYNSDDKKFVKTKVLSVAKVEHNNLVEIDFGDRVITSTDDHPYLSDDGWKSCNPKGTKHYKGYENVKELKAGDNIYFIGKDGKYELKEVKGIKKVDRKEMCYTITKLENGDNFIADGAVVGVEERR